MVRTVIQLSDSHLSARHGYFVANWRRVVERLRRDPPDLVVNTGDVSLNGSDNPEDLGFALSQHRRIATRWRAVPGNHDVGEEPGFEMVGQPTNRERRGRWRDTFGADHWSVDVGGWRLVGINCFLYGSGLPEEEQQHGWLTTELGRSDGPVGLFLHKPLFVEEPSEEIRPTHSVGPAGRDALLSVVAGSAVRFVASGHLHQHRRVRWSNRDVLWGPSCAFPLGPTAGGRPELGWLRWELDGHDFSVEAVELPELERHDIHALRGDGRYEFLYQTPPRPPDPADLED